MLEALLWAFHNAKSGLCFPSYETIAEAIKALEDDGVLSWCHRLKRVRERCSDLFGEGYRIVPARTSNAYNFTDPSPAGRPTPPKSEKPTGTANQVYFSSLESASGARPQVRDL